jgi:shikimate kinase
MPNIFFVGLMGAGKTTVGRFLAKNLDLDFYDTDLEIEKRTGVRVPTIFEMEGEAGFRKREMGMIGHRWWCGACARKSPTFSDTRYGNLFTCQCA